MKAYRVENINSLLFVGLGCIGGALPQGEWRMAVFGLLLMACGFIGAKIRREGGQDE